jgi:hypothetical protein
MRNEHRGSSHCRVEEPFSGRVGGGSSFHSPFEAGGPWPRGIVAGPGHWAVCVEKVTLGQAARMAGLAQADFLRELGKRRIPIHYGAEELAEDLKVVDALT